MGYGCAESSGAMCTPMWLFDQRAGRDFHHLPKNHQSVLDAEGTDRHRTTSVVCSVVFSQGVAVVWGMGYACAESFYDSRCSAHTEEYDFLTHQKGAWHENTGVCGTT